MKRRKAGKPILSATPQSSALFFAIFTDSSDNSIAVTKAPFLAKLIVSMPMPHPISRTRFPFHFENSANSGICGSVIYFFISVSSKYSLDNFSFFEEEALQGLSSQYFLTSSVDFILLIYFPQEISRKARL